MSTVWVIDFYGFACDVSAFAVLNLVQLLYVGSILDFKAGIFKSQYFIVLFIAE